MSKSIPLEKDVRKKVKKLGRLMGFEIDEEWSPSSLREKSREDFYIPRIDVVWFKKSSSKFVKFLKMFERQNVLDPYRDLEKEIVYYDGEARNDRVIPGRMRYE